MHTPSTTPFESGIDRTRGYARSVVALAQDRFYALDPLICPVCDSEILMFSPPSQLDERKHRSHRKGAFLHRWFDVLVVAEQIRWVVLLLQLCQTLIVGTIGCPDQVRALFELLPDVVDVDPAGGVRL
jgi:hypothetical protein